MFRFVVSVLRWAGAFLRSRQDLALEILALRRLLLESYAGNWSTMLISIFTVRQPHDRPPIVSFVEHNWEAVST